MSRRPVWVQPGVWCVAAFLAATLVAVLWQPGAPVVPSGFESWEILLRGNDRVVQTLLPQVSGIAGVSLHIGRVEGDGDLVITCSVGNVEQSRDRSCARQIPLSDLHPASILRIGFDPAVEAWSPVRVQLSLRSSGSGVVGLRATEGQVYDQGALSLNGAPLGADLVLETSMPRAAVWRRVVRAFDHRGGAPVAGLLGLSYLALVIVIVMKIENAAAAVEP